MGLSSSQARLLSLTSRQHSVEGRAQCLMANKLRLANDSDAAYTKYINALDDTYLKTLQTNIDNGGVSWIDGSINNLLRYQTSDKYTGSVFYVQDLASGQLYIPTTLGNAYDDIKAAGGNIRDFAEKFEGIRYEKKDRNENIVLEYNRVISAGYDKVLAPTQSESKNIVKEYYLAMSHDSDKIMPSKTALQYIPSKKSNGLYQTSTEHDSYLTQYKTAIFNLKSSGSYETQYTASERALIDASLILLGQMGGNSPENYQEKVTDGSFHGFNFEMYDSYKLEKQTTTLNGNEYISTTKDYSDYEKLMMMLNGGTQTWTGKRDYYWKWEGWGYSHSFSDQAGASYPHYKSATVNTGYTTGTDSFGNPTSSYGTTTTITNENSKTDYTQSKDIYNDIYFDLNGVNTNAASILRNVSSSYTSFGEALRDIVSKVANQKPEAETVLERYNITVDDINHYEEYTKAAAAFAEYQPEYYYVANNTVRAAYYEQIFNAIEAAGGWIEANTNRAGSASWVNNMIKNAQVMLVEWDDENEMLTKTSSSLHTNLKSVSDENYVEQVSQEYEETLAEINAKDTRYDEQLSKLESERDAIDTEIQALKKIVKDNVDTYFKVFT